MLLAIYFDEDFINIEGVAIASVLSLQPPCMECSELYAPETDCFSADDNTPLSQDIFNVSVTEIEAILEPDSVGNDIWRKSVAFVGFHPPSLSIWLG